MYDADTLRAAFNDALRAFKEAAPDAAASFLNENPQYRRFSRDARGTPVGEYLIQTSPQVTTRVSVYDQNGTWVGYQGDLFLGELDRAAVTTNETFRFLDS